MRCVGVRVCRGESSLTMSVSKHKSVVVCTHGLPVPATMLAVVVVTTVVLVAEVNIWAPAAASVVEGAHTVEDIDPEEPESGGGWG